MPADIALSEFLRASRARLSPTDVGLPEDGRRRKVPGLRREEVARLANVSVDYVTRLEQGRMVAASRPVLEALADALALRPDEREYLLTVAGPKPARAAVGMPRQKASAQTQLLLDTLHEMPAFVLGRYHDVLAWNRPAAALFTDFAAMPERDRNLIRLTFLDPAFRELYDDWPRVARSCVANLRMDAARYPEDPALAALVGELSVRDADFRGWWGSQRVRADALRRKTFRHPLAGVMTLAGQQLTLVDHPDQRLVAYSAADASSQQALRFLVGWANTPAGSQ